MDHLAVVLTSLATRPLGADVRHSGDGAVFAPCREFADYLELACGQVRRYGAREPSVVRALLRLLPACAHATTDPVRRAAIGEQLGLLVEDAERTTAQPADLVAVRVEAESVRVVLDAETDPAL